uniref:Uncharacterized protein n=1 Tax=Glossina pallidipes TaxID=7398 RepID=A0A1B0A1A3_GLOPL
MDSDDFRNEFEKTDKKKCYFVLVLRSVPQASQLRVYSMILRAVNNKGEIFGVGVSGVAKECIIESCNTSDSSINERPTELRENSKSFFCDDFCEFSVSVKFVVRLLLSVCLNVNREALVRQHLPSESISKTRSSEDELSEQFCLKSKALSS